jgi:hypothetical protein
MAPSPRWAYQPGMNAPRAPERRNRRRRIEQQVNKPALLVGRESNEVGFRNRPIGGLLGGGDDEVADAATLELGRLLDDG